MIGHRTATTAFDDANACDLASSRKPELLGVSTRLANRAVAKGLLVPAGDGRHYLKKSTLCRREMLWIDVAPLPPALAGLMLLGSRLLA